MRITERQLRRIIREETAIALSGGSLGMTPRKMAEEISSSYETSLYDGNLDGVGKKLKTMIDTKVKDDPDNYNEQGLLETVVGIMEDNIGEKHAADAMVKWFKDNYPKYAKYLKYPDQEHSEY